MLSGTVQPTFGVRVSPSPFLAVTYAREVHGVIRVQSHVLKPLQLREVSLLNDRTGRTPAAFLSEKQNPRIQKLCQGRRRSSGVEKHAATLLRCQANGADGVVSSLQSEGTLQLLAEQEGLLLPRNSAVGDVAESEAFRQISCLVELLQAAAMALLQSRETQAPLPSCEAVAGKEIGGTAVAKPLAPAPLADERTPERGDVAETEDRIMGGLACLQSAIQAGGREGDSATLARVRAEVCSCCTTLESSLGDLLTRLDGQTPGVGPSAAHILSLLEQLHALCSHTPGPLRASLHPPPGSVPSTSVHFSSSPAAPPSHNPHRRCLSYDLHTSTVPYADAWAWQKQLVAERTGALREGSADCGLDDALLLLQHCPVYTMGTRSSKDFLRFDPEDPPADFYYTERGGEVTYHGPGQIVMYPVLDLRRHQKDSHWYLRSLEEVVIRTLGNLLGIEATRSPGLTGVWAGGAKVAAVGVRVTRWITYHGVALNVVNDLSPFKRIVPCGISDKPVGSVRQLLLESALSTSEPLGEALAVARSRGADGVSTSRVGVTGTGYQGNGESEGESEREAKLVDAQMLRERARCMDDRTLLDAVSKQLLLEFGAVFDLTMCPVAGSPAQAAACDSERTK